MFKNNSSSKRFIGFFVSLLAVSSIAVADENDECSNKSFKGDYSFSQYGEIINEGPAADVGFLTADGKGSFTGSEVVHNSDGQVVNINFCNGTYEVTESCYVNAKWDAEVSLDVGEPAPCGLGFFIGERTATIAISKGALSGSVISTVPGAVLVGPIVQRHSED